MASSSRDSGPAKKKFKSNVKAIDFIRKKDFSMRCSDDLQMIYKTRKKAGRIKLCSSPNLAYLNLLDYVDKRSDYRSSVAKVLRWEELENSKNDLEKTFETHEKYTSFSIFLFYVNYLKRIPKNSIDVKAFDKRICKIVNCCMEHWGNDLRELIIYQTLYLYTVPRTEKILLPLFLKHLCNTDELITYGTNICSLLNANLTREILQACVDSGFNLWNYWERNDFIGRMCTVMFFYFRGGLDYLKVFLDFGYKQTDHKIPTLKLLLQRQIRAHNHAWIEPLFFKYTQSSRSANALEVFLFLIVFFALHKHPCITQKCFFLAWEARKDPLVTKQEILPIFEDYMRLIKPNTAESLLNHYMPMFVEYLDGFRNIIFPNSLGLVPQPRSLKHLCRCTVRDVLHDNGQMPRAVPILPIPEELKSYILLSY